MNVGKPFYLHEDQFNDKNLKEIHRKYQAHL